MTPQEFRTQYAEAVREEQARRLAAFLRVPRTVCGVDIVDPTPRRIMLLDAIGSPFYNAGKEVGAADIAMALWILSKDFAEGTEPPDEFVAIIAKGNFEEQAEALFKIVNDAFADAPGGSGERRQSYFYDMAGMVDSLAIMYGWTIEYCLDVPLAIAWQLIRAAILRTDRKAILSNPSEAIRTQFLNDLNAK